MKDFSDKFYAEADTNITIRQIRKVLRANIKRKNPNFEKEKLDDIVEQILAMNGIDLDHFNFIKNIEKMISSKMTDSINDVSIDANANKNEKTIEGIFSEAFAPVKKAVGFDYLYRTMKELYGKQRAKRLSAEMYDYSLGLSDSTNIMKVYCYAMDASKLVTIGREFGSLQSGPSQRISSYISALCETIHQMSSHLAGAIAIGTLFFDIAHLSLYKMNLKLDNLSDPKCRKHYENEFQQFVHSVNHLSRNSNESPFTNISIFDSYKIKNIVSDDGNLKWYFPKPEWYDKDEEEWFDYVTEFISEIQNIFLDFFDKGDPMQNGLPYRFPVCTLNFSKTKNENDEFEVADNDFLQNAVNRDIYRYNIFMSEGTKVASCCFEGNEYITVLNTKTNEIVYTSIKDFVNSINSDINDNGIKIDKEWKIKSLNPDTLELEDVMITGILKKENSYKKLYKIKCNDKEIKVTPDHVFLVRDKTNGKLETINATDLYEIYSMYMLPIDNQEGINRNTTFYSINKIEEIESTSEVYDIELEKNHYFAANDIISHNCRLISDTEMLELAEQSNSFGAGALASLGSHRVVTINFNRIALEAKSIKDFWKIYNERIQASREILIAHKVLIDKLTDANLQMFIKKGWINVKRLYSTFGILGIVECAEIFKQKFNYDDDITAEILKHLTAKTEEFTKKDPNNVYNIEQIPGESYAVRLANVDKLLYADEEGYYNIDVIE